MQQTPYIPETAPFTPEQRDWLNGFLAGLFSGVMPISTSTKTKPARTSLKIAVLHASQSGTGEGLARKVVKELKAKGHIATVASLDSYNPYALANEQHAVLIASTYGEGDPPDGAKPFFQQLCLPEAPRLDNLSYSVLALGDKHYEHFCKFGSDLDERLESLGARRITPKVECDLDLDEPFARWKASLLSRLEAIACGDSLTAVESVINFSSPAVVSSTSDHTHNRENPYYAKLVERRALTNDVSSKLTVHLALSLQQESLPYEAGDALGVIAQNDPRVVAEVLQATRLGGSEPITLAKFGEMTVSKALTNYLQITRLNRKLIESFAHRADAYKLQVLLIPEHQAHLESFCYDRGLIDLLLDYPGAITSADELVNMLPRLTPRLYSISSSPTAHHGQVHTTVAVVRYRSHNRDRGGVCSTLLAERIDAGETIPVYIQPNKRFRLPQQGDAPIIMIGPGTGIAPFRAFLHERHALGCNGRNWLFFGERSAATDFIYRDELQAMQADGHLTRLDLAFSRDQEHKIYVQDRMLEQGREFWQWLQDGASVYVCGDASRMAKDVDATLLKIIEEQGGLPREAATEYIQQLKDQRRYQRDVY
jgi:sulfite reductase (NADPH) flavoprotein alpha-component